MDWCVETTAVSPEDTIWDLSQRSCEPFVSLKPQPAIIVMLEAYFLKMSPPASFRIKASIKHSLHVGKE